MAQEVFHHVVLKYFFLLLLSFLLFQHLASASQTVGVRDLTGPSVSLLFHNFTPLVFNHLCVFHSWVVYLFRNSV